MIKETKKKKNEKKHAILGTHSICKACNNLLDNTRLEFLSTNNTSTGIGILEKIKKKKNAKIVQKGI